MSASLQGTMVGPPDPQEEFLKQLAAAAQQAQAGAGQAQGQYQQAAAQPPPELDLASMFVPTLLGNLASTIAQDPSYKQHAHEQIGQQRKSLLEARAQNLQSLRDSYLEKAKQADEAGDIETATKIKTQYEKASQAHDLVLQNLKNQSAKDLAALEQKNALELQASKNKGDVAVAGVKAKAAEAPPDYFDSLANTTRHGSKYLDLTNVPTKDKRAAMEYASKNGLVPADKATADRLASAEEVYKGFDEMEQQMQNFLPATAGERLIKGPLNQAASASQTNPDITAFNNSRLLAIRNIQALAAGAGSGFRLNQAEIAAVTKNFPKITDTLPVAQAKLEWERKFLLNKERSLTERNAQAPGGVKTTGNLVKMIDKDGRARTIDAAEVPDAISKGGWKRAPAK